MEEFIKKLTNNKFWIQDKFKDDNKFTITGYYYVSFNGYYETQKQWLSGIISKRTFS